MSWSGPRDLTAWIDGKAQNGSDWTEVRDPYRGDVAVRTAETDTSTVDLAVRAAEAAQPDVARLPSHERAAILRHAADLLASRAESLAEGITRETGKVLRDTRREAARVPWTLRTAATAAETMNGTRYQADAVPLGEGLTAFSTREPIGVVAAVTPFNAPLNLVAHKIAPAIAAGNAIVVKPAPAAPLPAFEVAWALEEAGLPPGAINVVLGEAETAHSLVTHPSVSMVTFTGGATAGEAIRQAVGFRKLALELGGNSANVVHHDSDLAHAVEACLRGGFGNAGQSCNSVQRIIVQRDVRDEFCERLVDAMADLTVGDPLDLATEVGPVVNEASAIRVEEWIEEAVEGGADVLAGGTREGATIAPTVVTGAPDTCRLSREEVFAPVVLVRSYDEIEEAFAFANAIPYGLQAGVFTSSLDIALEAGKRLRVGGVMVNRSSNFRLDHLPYGGIGESGLGREGAMSAVEEMTEVKLVVIAPGS